MSVLGNIPEFVRRKRLQKKWSQEELSERAGVDCKTISRYESGRYDLRIKTLELVLRAIGISSLQELANEYTTCGIDDAKKS